MQREADWTNTEWRAKGRQSLSVDASGMLSSYFLLLRPPFFAPLRFLAPPFFLPPRFLVTFAGEAAAPAHSAAHVAAAFFDFAIDLF